MAESHTQLDAVLTGRAVAYSRAGSRSGIAKTAVAGPRHISSNGIDGDEQGDLRVHGGPEKAVHHYAFDHYAGWRAVVASRVLDAPGAFGENFSTIGWTEENVHLGDIIEVGTCVLQVSQARQPCWKLNDRFGHPRMAAMVQSSGRTGWYYRVLREGWVEPGDNMRIVDRPFADWPLARLVQLLFHRTLDRDLLEAASLLPLPVSWHRLIRNRIDRNETESWRGRLEGPPETGRSTE